MDRRSTHQDRLEVMNKFIRKLKDSGYDHPTRSEIILSGLTRYYRKVAAEIAGTAPIHR